jgi:hypothetical protein
MRIRDGAFRLIQLSTLHAIKDHEICDYYLLSLLGSGERYLYFETNVVQLLKVHQPFTNCRWPSEYDAPPWSLPGKRICVPKFKKNSHP